MADTLSLLATMPEPALFAFPPTGHAAPVPPPAEPNSILHPFNIPDSWFTAALDAKVPITIAATYAVTVKLLNYYNKSRGNKAWAVSKTSAFKVLVILHNVFLAVYSAWTFVGMLGGMRRSIVSPMASTGLAGTADSFCRVFGAPGLGNSIYHDDTTGAWATLAAGGGAFDNGMPSRAQGGRLWNEGLAYYGWIFYLSKFYEVIDTLIILAKGKPSSTLQTYHHAGAMLCMWAGIRFMSSPIWVFVLVNSFIHSLMYTYYTVTAFHIKVPVAIKRSLTTMQITQFLLGGSYTMLHSFVSYVVPMTVVNEVSVPVDAPSAPATDAGALDAIRNLVFGDAAGHAKTAPGGSIVESTLNAQTVHVTQPCIMTTGETFAIWLNVLYLAPLTYLFMSFFIASYLKRSNAAQKTNKINGKGSSLASRRLSNEVTLAEKAGWDAAKGVQKEVYGANGSAISDDDSPKKGKAAKGSKRRA
ncbi:GNS1/SUR4 family-domain-containing protein [Emericellopsis atlantica]|uniref:Elongation of fatty acids protein n=1 Tax=Emericellopsis atlantica TaxID=2614577 RepID=A0A9P8CQ96_9HYPO|nr:GNS1/SUR4 family-domain-containing protein [Emericellopsis atlantica]KAG9254880.1 GNS1/SUR4 family-domain-containing protein [Emericellopsis atlantica]